MSKIKNIAFVDFVQTNLKKFRRRRERSSSIKLYFLKFLPISLFVLTNLSFLIKIGFSVFWWLFITVFFDHRIITDFKPTIRIWFGVPGAGKTTMAAFLCKHSLKNGYKVLSNVQIKGAYRLDPDDLGRVDMSFGGAGCHVLYDEGSIDFDNRNFKSFAQSDKPRFFALHRHMNCRVDVFSQAYDIDKRIRDRAGSRCMFQLKRFPIPGFVYYRSISKILYIDKEDKQLIDGFQFVGLPRVAFVRDVWKSFDTLDTSLCPKAQKRWEAW